MAKTVSKYTPGPWSVVSQPGSDTHHPEFSIESDFGAVASVVTENCDVDEQCAGDARLIAAAPELLAACKEITRVLDSLGWANVASDWPVVTDACELARAAIAKAEGK